MINVTNGKLIRLLVDDEPFDIRYGQLRAHERVLDFRAGTLSRTAEWASPAGRTVRVTLGPAGLVHPARCRRDPLQVEPLDGPVRVVVQSELVANEQLPPTGGDPRAAAALEAPLGSEEHCGRGRPGRADPPHRAQRPAMAAAMDHEVALPEAHLYQSDESRPDLARLTSSRPTLEPGERLRAGQVRRLRLVAERSRPALRDQVDGALLDGAVHDRLGRPARRAAAYLDDFWEPGRRRAGRRPRDPAGGPVRAVPRAAGRRPRRAPGDPGEGADRHRLRRPRVLGHRDLRAAGADLHRPGRRGRRAALAALHAAVARDRAQPARACAAPRSRGAPSTAQECSGYWPAGTAAFHINADIADAVTRYVDATGDDDVRRATVGARTAGADGPAVALARPPRRRRASSASTASPGPTSTARSPTTTSTPT